jgi:hypothetical protein
MKIVTHHCRECGDQVSEDGFCAAHPKEIVDTILSVHPLRAAVEAAETALETAQAALDAIPEPADDCPEGWAVSRAEDALHAAELALVGSDCPRQWELREEGYEYDEITADSLEEALEEARSNVDRGNYSDSEGTLYINVSVHCEETGEQGSDTVTCEPDEPDCADGETHDWQSPIELVGGIKENPGCWGHGGGVIYHEVCRHCGCKRTTDTWAQNPQTGEQGLREVSYEENAYAAEELAAVEWE